MPIRVLVDPFRQSRFFRSLFIDDSLASHSDDRTFQIFQGVGDFKDSALQLYLKLAIGFSDVLQFFDLFVEDIDKERHRHVLVVSNRVTLAIASRRTRITHNHDKLVFLHAAHRDRQKLLRLERHIFGSVLGWFAIWPSVHPHESEVAVMPWPFKVVRIASEEADALWRRVNNANVPQR